MKRKFRILFSLLVCLLMITCSSNQPESKESKSNSDNLSSEKTETIGTLREEADALLNAHDNVEVRRNVHVLMKLVDKLLIVQDNEEAFKYLHAMLQHYPWALDYQIIYAGMLNERGEKEKAEAAARIVMEYSETDALVNKARVLLGEGPLPAASEMVKIEGHSYTLSLVPIGKTDMSLLLDLKRGIEGMLPIEVHIQDAGVIVPPYKRDREKRYIEDLRGKLLSMMDKEPKLAEFLERNGINLKELDDEAVLSAYRKIILEYYGQKDLEEFNAVLEQLRGMSKQWDADDLMKSLKVAVAPYRRDGVLYLGITNLDMYANDNNFLFGWSVFGGQHAVMSYRRFSADFNDEPPNRERLSGRALKQSLSSIGLMLGLERCTDPTCARAYPHSLSEHDAKNPRLCRSCNDKFNKVFAGR